MAYAGLSGAFGTVSLGQVWSASFNHVGGITDGSWFYGNSETSYRVGNALSYAMSAGAVSLQLDAIMDGEKDTGDAVDQLEFGMSIDLGEIGKVGLAYVDKKDVHTMSKPVVVIPEAMLGGSAPQYTLGGSAPQYELERGEPTSIKDAVLDLTTAEVMIDADGMVTFGPKGEGDTATTVTWEKGEDDVTKYVDTGTVMQKYVGANADSDDPLNSINEEELNKRGIRTTKITLDSTKATLAADLAAINGGTATKKTACEGATPAATCMEFLVFVVETTDTANIVKDDDGKVIGASGTRTYHYFEPDSSEIQHVAEGSKPGEFTGNVLLKDDTGYTGVTQDPDTGYTSSFGAYTGTYRVDENGMYVMTHEMDEDGDYVAKYVDDMKPTHVMKDGKYVEAGDGEDATHYQVMDAEGETAYTSTMHSRTYMSAPADKIEKGSRATHIAAQFNLGAVTAYLGYSQSEENGSGMKDKTTHYGVSGGLGDTGMSFHLMARNKDNANGMDTNPWLVGLTKGLGGGATVMVEHGNDDDGESGKTRFGLKVDF